MKESLKNQLIHEIAASDLHYDVLSDGPFTSEVVIIGEGPGEKEVREGIPFIGGAGTLLWDAMRKLGLGRHNCYVTNVVKRQISLSRKGNEKHIVHRDEYQKWTGILRWELSQLPNARIILILGNYALEAITETTGILDQRGSVRTVVLNGKTYQTVTTINPAYALRELKMEPMFLMDIKRLGQVVSGVFKEHKIDAIINPSYKEARAFISDLRRSGRPVALDIETPNGETGCIGLSNNSHIAMCINWRTATENRYTTSEEAQLLLDIQELCDNTRIIAQNGQFDAYFTRLRDWLSIPMWFDTLLAHHTLYPQLPHRLAFLVAQYTTHPYYKDEGKKWKEGGDIDEYWAYNAKDAALTYAVHERELKELKEQGLDKFFFNHVMRATNHLVSATVHGLRIDHGLKAEVVKQCEEETEGLKAEFYKIVHELTGDPDYFPNPNSWQQLKVLLFGRLNLKGVGQSTDETNRDRIIANAETPPRAKDMLIALNKYIKEDKFVSTFATSKEGRDGRDRCEYRQYGVSNAPGRLSSAQLLTGEGRNLQNIPVRARSMYIADPDCQFIYFDLSQAEARIVAWRANIPIWKEQFERARKDGSYDCHRALAAEMFGVQYDQTPTIDFVDEDGRSPKDPKCKHHTLRPTIRYKAKRCRHGLNYRMMAAKLAEVLSVSFMEARSLFSKYHHVTPELQQWWRQAVNEFKRTRVVYNALGRRFKVIQRIDDDVLDSIIAFYPQSTIGDKVVQVWYQAEEDDKWPPHARVVLNVHDSNVAMCIAKPKDVKTVARIMKKYAESPIMIQDAWGSKAEPVIIPAEVKVSYPTSYDKEKKLFYEDPKGFHRWSHLKDIEL